jgi:hypothetical protein
MNTDVEELLREGMERFTRDLRAPVGLTRRVALRRRRRLAQRSMAGAAAVLVAGAAVLAVVMVPSAGENGTERPTLPAAYVVNRVDDALSAAEPGEIAQVMVTTTRGPAGLGVATKMTNAEEWSYGDQWRSVSYSSAGQPVYDEGSSASSVYTLVSYPTGTWARQRGLGRPKGLAQLGEPVAGQHLAGNGVVSRGAPVVGPMGCEPTGTVGPLLLQPGLPGIGFSASAPPATAARALRTAMSCGILAVAGRQHVNGSEAIELTSRPGGLITVTIWVRPGTDLPVRLVVRSAPGQPAFRMTADVAWLQPTTQNLAKLAVPIPAGFRRVSLAEAIGLTVLHIPGRQQLKTICIAMPDGRACQH